MQTYFKKYYFDLILFVGVLTYATNYFMGVRTNRRIATRIVENSKDVLASYFKMLGNGSKEEDSVGMDLDHSYQFEYYCND